MVEREPIREATESADDKLVRLLSENGPDDPEARVLLDNWTRDQEKMVGESADQARSAIELNIRRARLYIRAGFVKEGIENIAAALEQAWHERREDLVAVIQQGLDEVQRSVTE
jgi:hypothetical protein